MKIELTYYGRLAELTGVATETLDLDAATSTDLRRAVLEKHPALKNSTFQLAANNEILATDQRLTTARVDLFPPFSGG